MHYNPPSTITIYTPMPEVRPRGVHSLGTLASTLSLKVSQNDRVIVKRASTLLDMTPAAFMRWCSIEAAKKVIEDYERTHRERERGAAARTEDD